MDQKTSLESEANNELQSLRSQVAMLKSMKCRTFIPTNSTDEISKASKQQISQSVVQSDLLQNLLEQQKLNQDLSASLVEANTQRDSALSTVAQQELELSRCKEEVAMLSNRLRSTATSENEDTKKKVIMYFICTYCLVV